LTVSHSGRVIPGEVAPGTRSNRRPIKPLQNVKLRIRQSGACCSAGWNSIRATRGWNW